MMIPFCVHNISDDDCERCEVFGFRFNCRGCERYTNVWNGEEENEVIQSECFGLAPNGKEKRD